MQLTVDAVSFTEALKAAAQAAKTDKSTARMMQTVNTWRGKRVALKRNVNQLSKKIKQGEETSELLLAYKELNNVGRRYRAALVRVTTKYGFDPKGPNGGWVVPP